MTNSNAVAIAPPTELVDPHASDIDTESRLKAFRQLYLRDLNQAEWELFTAEAQHRGLSIIKNDIVAVKRKGKVTHQLTIHGARKLAARSQLYAGYDGPYWCGKDGVWLDVWLDDAYPAAAKFTVYRHDSPYPWTAVAIWKERVQTYWRDNREHLVETWERMPSHMIAKVAETDALKKAGLLTEETSIWLSDDALPGEDAYPPRIRALRKLHAIGAASGLNHDGVRSVVQAIAPGVTSLKDATVGPRELNAAASFVDTAEPIEIAEAVAGQRQLTPLADDGDAPGVPESDSDRASAQQTKAIRAQALRKGLGDPDLALLMGGAGWEGRLSHDEAAQWIAYVGKATTADLRAEVEKRAAVEVEAKTETDAAEGAGPDDEYDEIDDDDDDEDDGLGSY